jgi:hypothetical protein
MTTSTDTRTIIVDDIMRCNDERRAELRMELAFALAVRAAMHELNGKSVTRRIVGKVAEILGWSQSTIVMTDSTEPHVIWTLSAWGGETNRHHSHKLTAYLGYRDSFYSTKSVNFEGWAANHCAVERTQKAILRHDAVTREHAEELADALIAVQEAKARYGEIAESSPVSSYAEEAMKRLPWES